MVGSHPDFRLAGAAPDDPENYTNRPPHPMLHLLREEGISEVADDADALAAIPRRSTATLRALGRAGILARIGADADEPAG